MALAGRSSRRSRAGRWLVLGVVLTLVILLVDAALNSTSPATVQQLSTSAWVDRVLPLVAESTSQGNEINQIRNHTIGMSGKSISDQLHAASSGAGRVYQQIIAVKPPAGVNAASGLLVACLLVRSRAAASMTAAFDQALSAPLPSASPSGFPGTVGGVPVTAVPAAPAGAPNAAVEAIVNAGRDFEVADRAYQLFVGALPTRIVRPPPSTWVTDPSQYDATAVTVLLVSLRNSTSLAPVHQLSIAAVSTTPAPVSIQGPVQVLPLTRQIIVTIVVADSGNQPEKDLTVTASISPSAGASSVRDFLTLAPGNAQSLSIGPLNPPPGVPVTLTVTVTPAAGSPTAPATKSITLEMPGPNTVITTTSTTSAPTTTLPLGVTTTVPASPSTTH